MFRPSIWKSFRFTLKSLFKPKIWSLLLIPVIIMIITSAILLFSLWNLVYKAITSTFFWFSWVEKANLWLTSHKVWGIETWLTPVFTVISILFLANLATILITSLFYDSLFIKYVREKCFPEIPKKNVFTTKDEIIYNIKHFLLIIPCLLLSIIFLFVPVLPTLWMILSGGYLQSRMLSFSTLLEFVDHQEMIQIRKQYKRDHIKMGSTCMIFTLIPFVGVLAPSIGLIWFSHYNFSIIKNKMDTQGLSVI